MRRRHRRRRHWRASCAPSRIPIRASPAAGWRACATRASRSSAACWSRRRTGLPPGTSCASPSAARSSRPSWRSMPTAAVPRGGAGQPVWVTGPAARAAGHLLRARADAILVGRRHGARRRSAAHLPPAGARRRARPCASSWPAMLAGLEEVAPGAKRAAASAVGVLRRGRRRRRAARRRRARSFRCGLVRRRVVAAGGDGNAGGARHHAPAARRRPGNLGAPSRAPGSSTRRRCSTRAEPTAASCRRPRRWRRSPATSPPKASTFTLGEPSAATICWRCAAIGTAAVAAVRTKRRNASEEAEPCSPASSPTSARSRRARTAASPSARAIRRRNWRSAARWPATAAA